MINFKRLIFIFIIASACQSKGQLEIKGSINNSLKEVSAVEMTTDSDLLWAIQDAGNDSELYALNENGSIVRDIAITNASNIDWEDLTSDEYCNIYIGDFGNNNRKRKVFQILKIKYEDLDKKRAQAELIEFTLPKNQKSKDFEAFFLFNDSFYIFSKETKTLIVLKVPNKIGRHEAMVLAEFNLDGKNNKITSADISDDNKTVILLNHDKLWKLNNFTNDDFFSGELKELSFEHISQKEGVCFKNDSIVYLTDERDGAFGGNIYTYKLK